MKKTANEMVNARRTPVQERSKQRVEDILNISLQLIVEKGAEHLSLREVARLAGVPIASVYQYFPSKVGIMRELITRSREGVLQRLQTEIKGLAAQKARKPDVKQTVSRLVEAFLAHYAQDPSAIEVWGGVQADPVLRRLDAEDTLATATWLAPALLKGTKINDMTEAMALAMLMVETTASAARLVAYSERKYHSAIIASLKTMLASPLQNGIAPQR